MSIEPNPFRVDKKTVERIVDFLPYPFLIAEFRQGKTRNLFANQKFLEEIGYTCEEMPTIDDWFNVAYPNPEYRAEVMSGWNDRLEKAKHDGKDFALMKVIIHTKKNGDIWYEVKSSFFGRVQLIAFVNIHEEVIKEKELRDINENKNRILSILTHDLRSPITNLHALSRLVLNAKLSKDEFVGAVDTLYSKSQQVLDLLNTTLLWTKSNFDAITIKKEKVDLVSVIMNILSIYEDSIKNKGLRVDVDIDENMPITDSEILTILIRNLVSNAIKFSVEGGAIVINSKMKGEMCSISVRDTGIGLSAEMLGRINSDNYFSEKGTLQESGHGMGLKLCRQLLGKINGRLVIESEEGLGTTVSVFL